MTKFKDYFYGNKISDYGRANGRVDYATLAKAFDAVLNNDIMSKTLGICGEWEQESGQIDNSEEIEEIRGQIEELEDRKASLEEIEPEDENQAEGIAGDIEDISEKIRILEDKAEELENEQDEQPEIFQYYIVSDNGAEILKEFGEIVFYNSELDMYIWGVTHYGTSWSYVLTNIPCEVDPTAKA